MVSYHPSVTGNNGAVAHHYFPSDEEKKCEILRSIPGWNAGPGPVIDPENKHRKTPANEEGQTTPSYMGWRIEEEDTTWEIEKVDVRSNPGINTQQGRGKASRRSKGSNVRNV